MSGGINHRTFKKHLQYVEPHTQHTYMNHYTKNMYKISLSEFDNTVRQH